MITKKMCSFCGKEIEPGTGKMVISPAAVITNYCSSKCEKNALKLKRKARKVKWTEEYIGEKKIRVHKLEQERPKKKKQEKKPEQETPKETPKKETVKEETPKETPKKETVKEEKTQKDDKPMENESKKEAKK